MQKAQFVKLQILKNKKNIFGSAFSTDENNL